MANCAPTFRDTYSPLGCCNVRNICFLPSTPLGYRCCRRAQAKGDMISYYGRRFPSVTARSRLHFIGDLFTSFVYKSFTFFTSRYSLCVDCYQPCLIHSQTVTPRAACRLNVAPIGTRQTSSHFWRGKRRRASTTCRSNPRLMCNSASSQMRCGPTALDIPPVP